MRIKQILAATIALSSCLSFADAQTAVSPYKPGITENGITYYLPKTAFHVTITARRTVANPGEYAAYAQRFLRLNDVPQSKNETWKLESISVTPYGVANKDLAYSIKLKSKTSAPLVSLAADGRLLAINTEEPQEEPSLSEPSVTRHPAANLNPSDYKTEEILAAGSTTKMAELTAAEIYDIRENRSLLTKGQADFMPKDGEQLKLMLQQLETQETALLSLFKGTVEEETHVFTLDYVPSEAVERDVLFRFSRHFGLLPNDDLAGEPYFISVQNANALPEQTPVESDERLKKGADDLRYIVPGKGIVKIFSASQSLYTNTLPMSQFGYIEYLGGELFNKRMTTRVYLSPQTGGIQKIEGNQ